MRVVHAGISLDDAARVLHLSLREVDRLVALGKIPVVECAGSLRVPAGIIEWGSWGLLQGRLEHRSVLGTPLRALPFRLPARPARVAR